LDASTPEVPSVPQNVKDSFQKDGFAVFSRVLSLLAVQELNHQLEHVLRGQYNRGISPDKTPKLLKSPHPTDTDVRTKANIGPLGFSGNLQNVKVLQVINVHKSNQQFRQLAIHPALGKLVAELAGWKQGARLAQDQVWAKPPGAPPLTFHRDSPYFMFTPSDVVTVWVALDDMDEEIGPLQYVRGSHSWGEGRIGSSNQFFQANGGTALLQSAAEREGIEDLGIVSMAGLKAGGISIHDGRTWHGSGRNQSPKRPRRGLGLHFVPANVQFTNEATKSRLWKSYVAHVKDASTVELSEEDFPITWKPS